MYKVLIFSLNEWGWFKFDMNNFRTMFTMLTTVYSAELRGPKLEGGFGLEWLKKSMWVRGLLPLLHIEQEKVQKLGLKQFNLKGKIELKACVFRTVIVLMLAFASIFIDYADWGKQVTEKWFKVQP